MPKYLSEQAHEAIRSTAQGYAWPGGYPLAAWMADNEPLCPECLRSNLKLIVQATHDHEANPPGFDPQWAVVSCEVNWEDAHLVGSHCCDWIPSAYGEDPEEQVRMQAIALPLPEDDQP